MSSPSGGRSKDAERSRPETRRAPPADVGDPRHQVLRDGPGAPPVVVSPTPRFLWILRHAKAASDAPWGGDDQQRPLTARGRRDATALGRRLAANPVDLDFDAAPGVVPRPEVAVCSAAVRTRQTTDLVAAGMGGELPVDAYHSLYGADPDLLFQYVREIDESVTSALVVGHNPTVFEASWRLLHEPAEAGAGQAPEDGLPASDRTRLEAHGFPTCALALLVLDASAWEDVTEGSATLAGVFKPPY
jgi:phosphohistidine phosphatase